MPRYDFRCPHCGDMTLSTSWEQSPHVQCPRCDAKLTKLPSAPSFSVKGFSAKNGYSSGGKG